MSVSLDKNTPRPQSGYTSCACRDCMDITVSSDMTKPELCSECVDAGCDAWSSREGRSAFECQRDDAYGECTCDYLKAQYDPSYRQCAFCRSLES